MHTNTDEIIATPAAIMTKAKAKCRWSVVGDPASAP